MRALHRTLLEAQNPLSHNEVQQLLEQYGIDEQVAVAMLAHLQPVTGNGQAGLARRTESGDWRRAAAELHWLDTPRGRVRLVDRDDGWLSVNPLTREVLRDELRALGAALRSVTEYGEHAAGWVGHPEPSPAVRPIATTSANPRRQSRMARD